MATRTHTFLGWESRLCPQVNHQGQEKWGWEWEILRKEGGCWVLTANVRTAAAVKAFLLSFPRRRGSSETWSSYSSAYMEKWIWQQHRERTWREMSHCNFPLQKVFLSHLLGILSGRQPSVINSYSCREMPHQSSYTLWGTAHITNQVKGLLFFKILFIYF